MYFNTLKIRLSPIPSKISGDKMFRKCLFNRSLSSLNSITPTPSLIPPVTNSISLTPSHITSYRENGYHIVPNLLSPAQLEQWRKIIFSAVHDRAEKKHKFPTINEDDHTNTDMDYYDNVFTQRINLWQTHKSVKELLLESGSVIGKIAAELENLDCVRIWHD
jgi:hypothetical protein